MQTVYVLGNPLVEEDSLPLKLLPKLRSLANFKELDPTEELPEEKHLIIIDTVINTSKIIVIKDIDSLETQPRYSLHDFDLGMNLKLMKKMGKLRDVTIIGLPPKMNEDQALRELKPIITSLLSKSG